MSSSIFFESFALSWLATRAVVQMKASGYREYEGVVRRHLIPAFGGVPLEEVSTEVVQGWIARQKESGLAVRTIVNHVQVLRQILEYAVICGLIAENPVSDVVLPRQERTEMRYLTAEQHAASGNV